jgi:hypothetical protein
VAIIVECFPTQHLWEEEAHLIGLSLLPAKAITIHRGWILREAYLRLILMRFLPK